MNNQIKVQDKETNQLITIDNPSFYEPIKQIQDNAYEESSILQMENSIKNTVKFHYPEKPTEEYALQMWNILDKFEEKAWQQKNVGLKTGFQCIDKAFEGGIFPGFIIIGGDSNIGKSGFLTQLAWNIVTNNQDVYVMDFSLDDSSTDKIARTAACSGCVAINSIKTPLNYKDYPLMLIRRKQALLRIRANTHKYRVYDSATFSTFIEDIEKEITDKIQYFKANQINKKVVVFIDNFHDLNIKAQPNLQGKEKFDILAQWCSDMASNKDIPLICTAELKKLNGNHRPILDDIREAVKIKYEAKAILLAYNEVHYKGEAATVFFTRSNCPTKQPIFEVHFAKNKFGTYKGINFFEFYPEMAFMKECEPSVQNSFSQSIYG